MTGFGIQLPGRAGAGPDRGYAHLAGLATGAEGAGFSSLWVSDLPTAPAPPGPAPPGHLGEAPLEFTALLGALGACTSRIRLGALVTDVAARRPAILAKTVTTLDVITGGRMALGFCAGPDPEGGSGWADMLDEAVRICRAMFVGDDVSFAGRHFSVDHARNLPPPVQPGGPRILIGQGRQDDLLPLAARLADQCGVSGDASAVARTVGTLHRLCDEIGRDPAGIGIVWSARCILLGPHRRPVGGDPQPEGTLVGRPDQIPEMVAGHLAAGADEVAFGITSVDGPAVADLGRALGLSPAGPPPPP